MSENIYNLVPREYVVPDKKAMHRSHHDPKAGLTGSTFGKLNKKTMYHFGELYL